MAESEALPWVFDDGGRADAGYRGSTGDCVTRSLAIALDRPYAVVYGDLNALAQSERPRKGKRRSASRLGVHRRTYEAYLTYAGWEFTPTMGIGTGCTVHLSMGELPAGRLIVRLSRHLAAVIDGTVRDTHDPSRDGTRCVYGYYRPKGA